MNDTELSQNLLDFIKASPSCFHAVKNVGDALASVGVTELKESENRNLSVGNSYYVKRNQSALIAFHLPTNWNGSFMIIAAHADSPTFKIKDSPELDGAGCYVRIHAERYGGMILDSWFDRPLSVAGRVVVKTENGVAVKLVSVDRDLLLIPHLAIHMKNPNNGMTYDPASDMIPLYGSIAHKGGFLKEVADSADVAVENILAHDLYLVNRQNQSIWGADNEYISSPKLDDLQCVYAATQAFLQCERDGGQSQSMRVLYIADNEEVGSRTRQGAGSTFLYDTLDTVSALNHKNMRCGIATSLLLSADNAHAVHPNHPEFADPVHRPKMNGGIVVKFNASQSYTTDSVSAALFREICRKADVPVQTFLNRSDLPGGSTLGNISTTQVPVMSVDIGLAQLAMHSSYETAGVKDTAYMVRAVRQFFETSLYTDGDNYMMKI